MGTCEASGIPRSHRKVIVGKAMNPLLERLVGRLSERPLGPDLFM